MECSGSTDGIATCLRDKLASVGLLPPRDIAAPDEAPAPESVEPATDAGEAPTGPQITLLRAEPDGSLVIAGTAGPSSEVTIFANGEVLGTTKAEESGDWALVSENPLPAGTTAITAGPAGAAAPQVDPFLVTVDPNGVEQARIVAPGAIGGGDQPPPVEEETSDTGGAEERGAPEAAGLPMFADQLVAEIPAPAASQLVAPIADLPERRLRPAFPTSIVAEIPPPLRMPSPVPIFVPGGEPAEAVAATDVEESPAFPAMVVAEIPTPVRQQIRAADTLPTEPQTRNATEVAIIDSFSVTPEVPPATTVPETGPGPDLAGAEPDASVPGTVPPEVSLPTIDAAEIDGEITYFAGTAENGTSIRLYVDGELAGESPVDGGHWLVEARGVTDAPHRRIRAEVVVEGTGVASIEVNLIISGPDEAETAAAPEATTGPEGHDGARVAAIVPEIPPAPAEVRPPESGITALPQQAAADDAAPAVALEDGTPAAGQAESLGRGDALAAIAGGAVGETAHVAITVIQNAPPDEDLLTVDHAAATLGARDALAAIAAAAGVREVDAEALASSGAPAEASAQVAGSEPGVMGADLGRRDAEAAIAVPGPVVPVELADAAAAAGRADAAAAIAAREAAELATEAAEAAMQAGRRDVQMAIAESVPAIPVDSPQSIVAEGAPDEELSDERAATPAEPAQGELSVALADDAPWAGTRPVPEIPLPVKRPSPIERVVVPEPATHMASVEEGETTPETPEPIPTIRAMPLGEMGPMRFASGKVIIRRGDTLWDISRRVYGAGHKYQTIYRANRDRIPRPGRIYPGQVLDIPLVYE